MQRTNHTTSPDRFRPRSVLIGALGALLIGVGTTYNIMVVHGSYMAIDFSAAAALFLFFILVVGFNSWIGRIHPRLHLSPSELRLIYGMMLVACAIPTMGLTAQLLPITTSVFYYATPENNWAELIHPHIKPWMVPQDALAIKYFYEGLPSWESHIPWEVWIRPLLIWGSFLAALYLLMICMMVILRRQWMERERLVYPLAQLPIEMAGSDERLQKSIGGLPPLLRNRLLWLGFALAFGLGSLKGLHYYYPAVPMFELVESVLIFKRTTALIFRLSFPMLGFFYLVHLDVAFSLWFFNLLSLAARGFITTFGYHVTENLGIYGARSPIFAHQGMGAITVLVLAGLWSARRHLVDVFRKAFTGAPDVDDSDEILSYRAAVGGMLIGGAYMTLWLHWTGLPLWIVPIFLFAVFVLFVGLTRIVAESGMAEAVASTIGSSFVISGFGSRVLGPEGLTALSLSYVWSADIRTYVMASAANGLKVIDGGRGNRRIVFWGMALAILIAFLSSVVSLLYLSYTYGGVNGNSWFFGGGAVAPYNFLVSKLMDPTGPNWLGWWIKGTGALLMGVLMFLRQRFLWWPFHPIGFAIGPIWIMDQIWFTVLLAWLLKLSIVRYGGIRLYRTLRPLFLGLILGQFVCNGAWILLDILTGHQGNQIFWI